MMRAAKKVDVSHHYYQGTTHACICVWGAWRKLLPCVAPTPDYRRLRGLRGAIKCP